MLKLGTDGWSAVISEEFTFDNVNKLATAITVYLINNDQLSKPVIVGYDARFLADKAADLAVKVLERAGASVLLTDRDVPRPVLEWAVRDHDASCALMVTAGSNPPQYSGLQLMACGDLVKKDYLKKIDRSICFDAVSAQTGGSDPDYLAYLSGLAQLKKDHTAKSALERFDPRERYCQLLAAETDAETVKKARLKIVVDPMFGSARGYLDTLLERVGCTVEEIHNYRDVLFGGRAPDPIEENLAELKAKVAENKAALGIALSGDGGGFAVIDRLGKFRPAASFAGLNAVGSLEACVRIVELAARNLL